MNITPRSILKFSVYVLIAVAIGWLMWYFRHIVIFILVAAVIAIIGRPIVKRLSWLHVRGHHLPRWVAAALTLILFWGIFAAIFSLLVPLIAHKIYEFASLDLRPLMESLSRPLAYLQRFMNTDTLTADTPATLQELTSKFAGSFINMHMVNATFSSVLDFGISTLVAFFSISFITFFFMKEDGLFSQMVVSLFPEHYHLNVIHALDKVNILLVRYFTGLLVESTILMILVSGVLWLWGMRIENACFVGVLMGVLNTIPYAGPMMGGIAAVFIGLVTPIEGFTAGDTVVIIICSLLVLKGMDDFIMQPTIYSERVKAHPLEIFLVILIAGYMAGVLGMLLAIPSYTVLRVFAKEFFSQYALVQKLTSKV